MDSKLDPPGPPGPVRQPEPADPRQAIRREDRDNPRQQRRPRPDKSPPQEEWEDETIISIAALRAFLTRLLTESGQIVTVKPPPSETYTPHTQAAARAAQAYGGAARSPLQTPQEPATATNLSPAEIENIHNLNILLDRLAARGVTALHILKEGSFLQSLTRAAEDALKN